MEDTLQKKAEQLAAEVAAAKAEAAAAKAEASTLRNELDTKGAELSEAKTQIQNLDATAKDQAKSIEALKVEVKASRPEDFKRDFREAFYAVKDQVVKLANEKADRFDVKLEVKTINSVGTTQISPNNIYGVSLDPTIYGAVPAANAFVVTFGYRPRTGNKIAWLEGTTQTGAAYVAELAQNTAKSDVAIAEKSRKFAKIATMMQISTEIENWFDQLFNYCLSEGVRLIEAKIDTEICGGDGHDTNHPTDVYGVKGQSTAFSALAAGVVSNANVADVIMDAADQAAKEGFQANVCFLTWALYRELKEIKSTSGQYLFNNGLLNGIVVKPTSRLGSGQMLVLDSSCVEVYAGNGYELEMIRNGAYDAYDVYFRKAVQVVVPAAKQKGVIYVSNAATAKAALAPANG